MFTKLFKKIFGSREAIQKKDLVSFASHEPPPPPLNEDELKLWDEEIAVKRRLRHEKTIRSRLANLTKTFQETAKGLSRMANRAERSIKQAENEFKERSYAPFWDAVEDAALMLAKCAYQSRPLRKNITAIGHESVKLAKLGSKVPQMPAINGPATTDLVTVANQLKDVVRLAQKDFEFSLIYEQRRTNQILVEGFSTLHKAIQELGNIFHQSITRLNKGLSEAISDVADAQRAASALIADSLADNQATIREVGTAIDDTLQTEATSRRRHENEVEEMLDNIQRKRKPRP